MPESARAILVADTAYLDQTFSMLDLEVVRITQIFTNIMRPAQYMHPSGAVRCVPACDIDLQSPEETDLCIVLRNEHAGDVLARLAARGFDKRNLLVLDTDELFRNAPGLCSAARSIRDGQFRWRGFLTGLSYYQYGVEPAVFDHQVANFAGGGQDLYYDYALARDVLLQAPQRCQYAVIGLAPYSFDYDLALSGEAWRCIKYYPTLKDDHGMAAGLPLPLDSIFKPGLSKMASPAAKDLTQARFHDLFFTKRAERVTVQAALDGRKKAASWSRRRFPATQAANSQILSRYVDLCRSAGLAVFIATPPMSGLFLETYAAERMAEFHARLAPELVKPGVWFRDFYSEGAYDLQHVFDTDHLNTRGAVRFSNALRTWIEQVLAAAPAVV